MADGDGEDDGDDFGAPPIDPRLRVWTDPSGAGPATPEERAHFGIPEPSEAAAAAMAKIQARADNPPTSESAESANAIAIKAIVDKFPEFRAEWPVKLQERWFAAYERLLNIKVP